MVRELARAILGTSTITVEDSAQGASFYLRNYRRRDASARNCMFCPRTPRQWCV